MSKGHIAASEAEQRYQTDSIDPPEAGDVQTVGLPPDLVRGRSYPIAQRNLWHKDDERWAKIHKKTSGKNIKVAILDTGYNHHHQDLKQPIAEESFIPGETVVDGNGHGSHCAHLVLQFAPDADVIIGKVLSNRGGGSSDGIAQGIRWAVDQGADIISLSIGGGGYYQPMVDALKYAWSKGVVAFAAAGNSGFNGANSIDYPGKYPESICVAAMKIGGRVAGFSSGGREVDIACPGEDIVAASHIGSQYVSLSGTSMACPIAAGQFACLLQQQRDEGHVEFKTADDLRKFYAGFTEDIGNDGEDDRTGSGVPKSTDITNHLDLDDITAMGQVADSGGSASVASKAVMLLLSLFFGLAISQTAVGQDTIDTVVTVTEQTVEVYGTKVISKSEPKIISETVTSKPATAVEVETSRAVLLDSSLKPKSVNAVDGSVLIQEPGEYLIFQHPMPEFKRVVVERLGPDLSAVASVSAKAADRLNDPTTRGAIQSQLGIALASYNMTAPMGTQKSIVEQAVATGIHLARQQNVESRYKPWADWRRAIQAEYDRIEISDSEQYRDFVAEVVKGLKWSEARSTCSDGFCQPR